MEIVVNLIQTVWKESFVHRFTEIENLKNIWDGKIPEIINDCKKNHKKHTTILKRIRSINAEQRASILTRYYDELKKEYAIQLCNWIKMNKIRKRVYIPINCRVIRLD